MSLTASRLSLTHRCTIQRGASTADDWGGSTPPTWADHLTGVPCYAWVTAGREAVDATTTAVVEDARMIVAADTDVTEADRVGDVTYRGQLILAGPTGVRAVLRNPDHLELVLVRVS